MHIEFLVEDASGQELLSQIMKKYVEENNISIRYNFKSYKGIGSINKGKKADMIKSEQLLSELPKRLKAFQAISLYDKELSVFVVVDNDKHDPGMFYESLKAICQRNGITMDCVFCIAVEEMEAWLLGDRDAIINAYPELKDRIISKHSQYVQDSICGTWEFLADMLSEKGIKGFFEKNRTVYEVGLQKSIWAKRIGAELDINANKSPSFNRFIQELNKRKTG